ncbi:MAG TPA: polyprenyl synthetase family protein [Waddliaceae bacterium]
MTLEHYKMKINERLATLIPAHSPFFPALYEGGRYALLTPGKRVRPLLTLCTAEMIRKDAFEWALIPACALEMLHTYSLIHDDLPCMDDDDFRRNQPTLHRVYTEGHAVLIGDYLLTYAFEVIAKAPFIGSDQKIALTQVLATAAGGEGMIGGQMMDIENSHHIEQMHARKTAALFCAAVEFGGIIAQASEEIISILHIFGTQFGKLFQMVDDLLDGDHPLGAQKAEQTAHTHFQACLDTLHQLPGDTTFLRELTQGVLKVCSNNS